MGPTGGKALFDALKQHMSIVTIDVSWNNLGVEGLKSLCSCIQNNTTLSTLFFVSQQFRESRDRTN